VFILPTEIHKVNNLNHPHNNLLLTTNPSQNLYGICIKVKGIARTPNN
jgi:hypothetical protein